MIYHSTKNLPSEHSFIEIRNVDVSGLTENLLLPDYNFILGVGLIFLLSFFFHELDITAFLSVLHLTFVSFFAFTHYLQERNVVFGGLTVRVFWIPLNFCILSFIMIALIQIDLDLLSHRFWTLHSIRALLVILLLVKNHLFSGPSQILTFFSLCTFFVNKAIV